LEDCWFLTVIAKLAWGDNEPLPLSVLPSATEDVLEAGMIEDITLPHSSHWNLLGFHMECQEFPRNPPSSTTQIFYEPGLYQDLPGKFQQFQGIYRDSRTGIPVRYSTGNIPGFQEDQQAQSLCIVYAIQK
jgi:hypothetical protein